MTPTDEQQAAIEATKHSATSLLLEAYAGCAKTTTLCLMAREVKVPALALAFNVSIKKELAARFPGNFSVQTMNGLGMSSLMRASPGTNFVVDQYGKKLGRIINEVAREFKTELDGDQWLLAKNLVTKIMGLGLVPGDLGDSPLVPDTSDVWSFACDDLWIEAEDQEFYIDLAREVIRRNIEEAFAGRISFQDQIYVSTCIRGRFPKFPVLFVDEAQDLDPLNHAMLTKALRPDGRIIASGDARQAIYGFRGADSDSIGKIKALRREWIELPLTMTFRCPKAVVARQQGHAPGFRAAPDAPDGRFLSLPTGSRVTPLPGPGFGSSIDALDPADDLWSWAEITRLAPSGEIAVLCRNNAPLLKLAFKLLRRRVSIMMAGRDIGQGLISLSKKIFPSEQTDKASMASLLDEWETSERSAALINKQEEKLDGIEDRAESLRAVLSYEDVATASDLRREIRFLFSREAGGVVLSSIHRAKGLEWDTVLLLDPWRIPSKYAKELAKQGDDRALRQEQNLRYVAETRTKRVLIHASLDKFL